MSPDTLAIFDFDWTLFRSPDPPEGEPRQSFLSSAKSLLPPHVSRYPDPSMWIDHVVAEFRASMRDRHTVTALITGRRAGTKERVMDMIGQRCIDPDYSMFRSKSYKQDKNTVHFKRLATIRILEENQFISNLIVWEDSQEQLDNLEDLAKRKGLKFEPNLVSER